MKKLSELIRIARNAHRTLEEAIDEYNQEVSAAGRTLEDVLEDYEEQRSQVISEISELACMADSGEARALLNAFEWEPFQPDTADEIETPDNAADDLETIKYDLEEAASAKPVAVPTTAELLKRIAELEGLVLLLKEGGR